MIVVWRFWLAVAVAALYATDDYIEIDVFTALYDAIYVVAGRGQDGEWT
jgi:hypothetical protein